MMKADLFGPAFFVALRINIQNKNQSNPDLFVVLVSLDIVFDAFLMGMYSHHTLLSLSQSHNHGIT